MLIGYRRIREVTSSSKYLSPYIDIACLDSVRELTFYRDSVNLVESKFRCEFNFASNSSTEIDNKKNHVSKYELLALYLRCPISGFRVTSKVELSENDDVIKVHSVVLIRAYDYHLLYIWNGSLGNV